MLIFVTPAYNEELNIARWLNRIAESMKRQRHDYRVVVVDDGSKDRTADIVRGLAGEGLPIDLVSYQPNRGPGAAFQLGLERALELSSDDDLIVTTESDGTSDLEILGEMVGEIDAGSKVVVASCHAPGGRMEGNPWHRVFLSRSASKFISVFFPSLRGLRTLSSFYRIYKPRALRQVLAKYGRFSDEATFSSVVEILVRFSRLNLRISEVPMILKGRERVGKSKMKIIRNTLGYLRIIARNVRA